MRSSRISIVAALVAVAPLAAQDFQAGPALDLMPNTRVYGSFHFTESCSYDAGRDLYVAPSAGNRGDGNENDGYVSLINPDGSVHTLKWIGVDRNGLTLNHPLGSDIQNGLLYLADRNWVRTFDMETGEPGDAWEVPGATSFNDLEVASDGTVYMTQTFEPERVYRLTPSGESTILVDGAPLARPNGIAFDPDGNLVVVNVGSPAVQTFSPSGQLLRTEQSIDTANDGIVVMPDGTKYVSSVGVGTVARIRPGQPAEMVARGIPSAASMCYDPTRNRLVIPMNSWFALAFVELGM